MTSARRRPSLSAVNSREIAAPRCASSMAPSAAWNAWRSAGSHDPRARAASIAAFPSALAIDPDYAVAKFQRGQAYFRTKARAKAKADLEDFVAHAPPGDAFTIAQANKMLLALH